MLFRSKAHTDTDINPDRQDKTSSSFPPEMEKIMNYGVMSMPALMVDDKIVSAGKVLKAKEVEKYL